MSKLTKEKEEMKITLHSQWLILQRELNSERAKVFEFEFENATVHKLLLEKEKLEQTTKAQKEKILNYKETYETLELSNSEVESTTQGCQDALNILTKQFHGVRESLKKVVTKYKGEPVKLIAVSDQQAELVDFPKLQEEIKNLVHFCDKELSALKLELNVTKDENGKFRDQLKQFLSKPQKFCAANENSKKGVQSLTSGNGGWATVPCFTSALPENRPFSRYGFKRLKSSIWNSSSAFPVPTQTNFEDDTAVALTMSNSE